MICRVFFTAFGANQDVPSQSTIQQHLSGAWSLEFWFWFEKNISSSIFNKGSLKYLFFWGIKHWKYMVILMVHCLDWYGTPVSRWVKYDSWILNWSVSQKTAGSTDYYITPTNDLSHPCAKIMIFYLSPSLGLKASELMTTNSSEVGLPEIWICLRVRIVHISKIQVCVYTLCTYGVYQHLKT